MESILNNTKKMLGIAADYTHFDSDIIVHINSTFMTLNQLGVGPEDPAFISSEVETWSSVFGSTKHIEAIKSYVYLKVRLLFDPPTSSTVLEAMNKQAAEYEWRLNIQAQL